MPVTKGHGRARGSKVIADDVVPSPEVRGDLLDNEIQFDVSPKPDPAGEARNILVAMPPAKRAEVALESSKTEKQLRELVEKSSGIVSVVDNTGRDEVHRAAMGHKNARVRIKNTSEAAREDANAFAAACIAEEKRLIAIIKDEETRLFALRDAYDEKVKREKEEAERLARERTAAIRAKIDAIAHLPGRLAGASSLELIGELQKLVAMQPTAEEFDGMLAEMLLTIEAVGSALSALLDGARKREEVERQRIADQEAERARLDAQAEENRIVAERLAEERAEAERARVKMEQQREAMAEVMAIQKLGATKGAARDIDRALRAVRSSRIDETYGDLFDMAQGARDIAALMLEQRFAIAVAAELPGAHAEALIENAIFDAEHGASQVPAQAGTEPQFNFDTRADQLEAVAVTLAAAEPEQAAPVETMIDQISMSMAIGVFFDAVRDLRHHRTADEVRQHLEVVLTDVQGEISQGSRVYR